VGGKVVHLFPIEPIEERYSADWLRWWPPALEKTGADVHIMHGGRLQGEERGEAIQHGQFLDAIDTNYYKATQLATFASHLKGGHVRDGDTVLLLDGWNPSVTQLRYMRDVTKINFRIVGLLHAGTWDPWDHLTQCNMAAWAAGIELGWIKALDCAIVSTTYHQHLLYTHAATFGATKDEEVVRQRVRVAGFPLQLDELEQYSVPWHERPHRVVFPHRLAPEKQPEVFDELQQVYAERYPGDEVEWVRSQDVYTDKEALYQLLGSSRVAFSAARQETWGIVQLEAWYLGAQPVVPDRLSYRELYPAGCKYAELAEAADQVNYGLHRDSRPTFRPACDPRQAWPGLMKAIGL